MSNVPNTPQGLLERMLPIAETVTATGETVQFVSARALHQWLGVGRDFSNWFKERVAKYGFAQNVDFVLGDERPDYGNLLSDIVMAKFGETYEFVDKIINAKSGVNPKSAGRPEINYYITTDMAKELAMVENNEKGKATRRYFIFCEKELVKKLQEAYKSQLVVIGEKEMLIHSKDVALAQALQIQQEALISVERQTMLANYHKAEALAQYNQALSYYSETKAAKIAEQHATVLATVSREELEAKQRMFRDAQGMQAIIEYGYRAEVFSASSLSTTMDRLSDEIDDRCSPAQRRGKVMRQTKREQADHKIAHVTVKAFQSIGLIKDKNRVTH